MNLAALQRAFTDAMLSVEGPADIPSHHRTNDLNTSSIHSAELTPIQPDRLALYKHLVTGTLSFAMAGIFPRLKREMGDLFEPCLEEYFRHHPPRGWDSNEAGHELPQFLAEVWLPMHQELPPWWSELALYELAETCAFLAPDDAKENAQTAGIWVNSSLQLHVFQWDIPRWCLTDSEETQQSIMPEKGPVIAAIYRDPITFNCRFLALSPVATSALQAWMNGTPQADLVEELAHALQVTPAHCLEQLNVLTQTLVDHRLIRLPTGQENTSDAQH